MSALVVALTLAWPSPALALRKSQEDGVVAELTAGLEEPAPFVPWAGASDRVLVRAGPRRPLPDYPLLAIERLYEFLTPHLQRYLQETYGIDETPLVPLPGATRAFGKPIFLLREALLPTGSSKPRMLAALFDLYQNGDPWSLTGRRPGLPLPKVLGTQSTGNHLQAMAWFGQTVRSWGHSQAGKRLGWGDLQIIGFTMRGIPEQKRHTAQRLGATVWDQFADYGEARQAMDRMAREEGETFLRWNHGDRPIVLGNATMAIQLQAQMERQRLLRGRRVAIVSAAGAGGRIAGLSAGLTQGQGGSFTVIGAETDRIRPLFEAAKAGKPVPIALPPQRVPEDGIAVDQVEAEALRVFLSRGDAVALADPAQALSYTRWLLEELAGLSSQTSVKQWPTQTEVVTGMSLAVPFLYPALFEDVDAVIIDETGMNIDPDDLRQVRAVPLPEPAAGLEEPVSARWRQLEEGRTGPKGILVIPAGVLGVVKGLPELLDQLPDGVAQQILVWQETDTVLAIQKVRTDRGRAPLRVLRRAGTTADLADYLYWLLQEQDVKRIGVLGWNETSTSQLQAVLNRLRDPERLGNVSVKAVPASDLTELLKMLGVPESVSQQVGLEELLGERYVGSGT